MKKAALHSCTVLEVETQARQLWQFGVDDGQVKLTAHHSAASPNSLPARLFTKDWRSLWQRKLNIAWLPADQVFLRVVDLPATDFAELSSMVELQLEKLSPLPVNQIVWSMELGPRHGENLQSVIVIIAARSMIEEFLGHLEREGYQADRLELAILHQLLAAQPDGDAVWIYPAREGSRTLCLVVWWCGGTVRQLQTLHLPESAQPGKTLVEQLTKMAWAGEMEGWLTSPLRCCLVADAASATVWEPALREWAAQPVALAEPADKPGLAELSARKAAQGETQVNLLPVEFRERYRQQFVDHLWMTGLGALFAAYMVGVLIYFGALQVLRFQEHRVENQILALSGSYTNAVRLKARAEVLQNQLNLKYGALDCLRAASERLRGGLTLTQFQFSKGQKVTLEGTAEMENQNQLYDYNADLRKETVKGEPLFSKVEQPNWTARGQNIVWRFSCEINRSESE